MQSWSRPKDPDDIRILGFDWSPWFTGTRTAIETSIFMVEGGVTLDTEEVNGAITTFRVQGGVAGETCRITNRVTFNNGEQVDDTNRLRIKDR